MPLWFFPALLAFFALVSLVSAIWLILHLPDVARVFRGSRDGDMTIGPANRKKAARSHVWLALILFNAGWLACLAIWLLAIGGEANDLLNSRI